MARARPNATDRINKHLIELGADLCRKYGLSPLTATVDEVDAASRKRMEDLCEVCQFIEYTIVPESTK